MGSMSCPETSVRNYRSTLSKIPKEPRFHLHCGGSRNSSVYLRVFEREGYKGGMLSNDVMDLVSGY
jgi:hypothetical protein